MSVKIPDIQAPERRAYTWSKPDHVQPINYLSSIPGGGKTAWARRTMLQSVVKGVGLTIYAAPTHLLLNEVRNRMVRTITKRYPPDQASTLTAKLRLVDNEARTVLQVRDLQQLIRFHIEGGRDRNALGSIRPLEPGSILFMTHESFLRLESGYLEDGSSRFPGRDRIDVIFDEAQKCALQSGRIVLPEALVDILEPYLSLRDLPTDQDRLRVLQVKDRGLENLKRQIEAYTARIPMTKVQSDSLKTMLKILGHVYGDNVRIHAVSKLQYRNQVASLQLQTVLDPARVFYGWKSVTLMAAHLDHSQMFHMLSNSSVDQLAKETNSQYKLRLFRTECRLKLQAKIVPRIQRQEEALKRCWSQSYITYAATSQDKLSKNMLSDGVVATLEPGFSVDLWNTELQGLLRTKQVRVSTRLANSIARSMSDPTATPNSWMAILDLSEEDKEIASHLGSLSGLLHMTPLQYLVQRSIFLARSWAHIHGQDYRPLPISINIGSRKKNRNGEYREEIDQLGLSEGLHGDWIQVPFKSQGLNKFRHHNAIAFLAAVNPKRHELTALQTMCPHYDPDLDHVVDQAVQALTRSSIRMPNAQGKRLLILADETTARLVHEHGFLGKPRFVHPGDLEECGSIRLDRDSSKELRKTSSIVAIRVRSRTKSKERETYYQSKKTAEAQFIRSAIPEYKEYLSLTRRLKSPPRGKFNPEAATLRLATLESSIGDAIKTKRAEFKRRWANGEFEVKPEL